MLHRNTSSRGFTLIELMLAMAFFTSILTISTVVFVQMLTTYNKGVAVKEMNQIARTFTDNLSRVSNSTKNVSFGDNSTFFGTDPMRCLRIGTYGGDSYVWSYAGDVAGGTGVYEYAEDGQPVPLSHLNTPAFAGCPNENSADPFFGYVDTNNNGTYDPGAGDYKMISKKNLTPLVSSDIAVYATTLTYLKTTDTSTGTVTDNYDTVRIKFVLGTYSGPNSPNNPIMTNGVPSCQGGSLGNYCAFSTFETVLYTPNAN